MKGKMIEQLLADGKAVSKLFNSDKMEGAVNFRLGIFIKKLNLIIESFIDAKKMMIQKFAEKDNEGNVISDDGGKTYRIIRDSIPQFNKEFEKLMDEEFKIENVQVNVSDGSKAGLTPNDFAVLSEFIDFVEDTKEEKEA